MKRMLFIAIALSLATPCSATEVLYWMGTQIQGVIYDPERNGFGYCYSALWADEEGHFIYRPYDCPTIARRMRFGIPVSTVVDIATRNGRHPAWAMMLSDGRLLLY